MLLSILGLISVLDDNPCGSVLLELVFPRTVLRMLLIQDNPENNRGLSQAEYFNNKPFN